MIVSRALPKTKKKEAPYHFSAKKKMTQKQKTNKTGGIEGDIDEGLP